MIRWLTILVALTLCAASASSATVTRCDQLASDPFDDERLAAPVQDEDLKTDEAKMECRKALAADPESGRLNFLYGRVLSLSDPTDARRYFQKSISQGYAAAFLLLAGVLSVNSTTKTVSEEQFKLVLRAAELENRQAQYLLGGWYRFGRGVEKDFQKAFRWVKMAADRGHTRAQFSLSAFYLRGWGTSRDLSQAVRYARIAATKGYAPAQYALGRLLAFAPPPVVNDVEEALKWFEKAAEGGPNQQWWNLA